MSIINSNGTGGGNWLTGASWNGGVAPTAGDRAVILASDTIYIDGDITIGDGSTSDSIYAVDCAGDLVWRNRTSDASSNWTFTVDGHMRFTDGSYWYIGSEDNSVFGSESVGPLPATRTATIEFSMQYYHRIFVDSVDNADGFLEIWGAEDYHQGTAPSISGQTVDSAANKVSFVDAARTSDAANLWRGAWLEITAGTNIGEKRAITSFDSATGTISWDSNQPMPDPCDATSVYSVTHNYQRALLTANANSGSPATILLDRDVDWEVGDTIAIGIGADFPATGERPDYTTIASKVSATQYTCNLTYNHTAGDMVIHMDKNIRFYASDLTGVNEGYYFYMATGKSHININWAFFDEAGSTNSNGIFYWFDGSFSYPIVRNCTVKGYLEGAGEDFGGHLLYTTIYLEDITEEYMIENIHGYNLGGIVYLSDSGPNGNITIEEQENLKIRDLSLIGASLASKAMIQLSSRPLILPEICNIWLSGRPRDSGSGVNGMGLRGTANLDGFKFWQCGTGIHVIHGSADFLPVHKMTVKNGEIHYALTAGMYLYELHVSEFWAENVDMRSCADAIELVNPSSAAVFLKNNKYNGSGGSTTGALLLDGYGTSTRIMEMDGEYGEDVANIGNNITRSYDANYDGGFRYVSYNTKYNTPTSQIWSESLVNDVFGMYLGDTWSVRAINLFGQSSMEANNPIINGSPSHSIAIINAGGILENLDHPSSPREDSNIKMKITPFGTVYDTKVNLSVPFLAYAAANQTVSASVYVRKNVSQTECPRPKLHVWGNGVYKVTEMSDAIDSWEQLSISYTAQFDGAVMAWITCSNNLKYGKDSLTGDAELGEPDVAGTVVVYADELSITAT
jgi:hypothetical protein